MDDNGTIPQKSDETVDQPKTVPPKRTRMQSLTRTSLIILASTPFAFCCPISGWIMQVWAWDLFIYAGPLLIGLAWIVATVVWTIKFRGETRIWDPIRLALICLAAGICFFTLLGFGGSNTHSLGFSLRMGRSADVPAIQAWAKAYHFNFPIDPDAEYSEIVIQNNEWPPCVRALKPSSVWIRPKTRNVELVYGGGFGHWGVRIYNGPSEKNHSDDKPIFGGKAFFFEQQQ